MIPLKDVNPTRRPAVLTILLIVVCALVFAYQQTRADDLSLDSRQGFICEYGLIADNVVHGPAREPVDGCDHLNQEQPRFMALLTSLFLHADWLHLGFNMLFLWVFGNNVEARRGWWRYLLLYLAGGLAATAAHVAIDPSSTVPIIGASGAIAAVMGAYLICWPTARIKTIVFVGPLLLRKVEAIWLLLVWIGQQFFLVSGDSGIAWAAHVGGFVFGVGVGLWWRRQDRRAAQSLPAPVAAPA